MLTHLRMREKSKMRPNGAQGIRLVPENGDPGMTNAEARAFIEEVRPFDALSADELARVAEHLTPGRFAPGETILRRLAHPSALFVIADGTVEEADQAGPVALYSRGDTFDPDGSDQRAQREQLRLAQPQHVLPAAGPAVPRIGAKQ